MRNTWVVTTVAWICVGAGVFFLGLSEVNGQQKQPTPEPVVNLVADQALRDASFDGQLDRMVAAVEQGARINVADADGRTALMFASFNGHTHCVRWLLDREASVTARENLGRTALMFASTGPFADTVSLLLERASNPNDVDEYENWNALMFAAGEGQVEVIKVLLEYGADPSAADKDGDTAAYHAAQNKHPEAEALLRAAMD